MKARYLVWFWCVIATAAIAFGHKDAASYSAIIVASMWQAVAYIENGFKL